jgi:catechol 2,3-dioxygenase-like lactoylglutathione lyase family enzyme
MKSGHIRRIAYIRIGVKNLKESVAFYQDVLGLEKISEWQTGAIFDIAGVSLGLELEAEPEICLLADDVDKAYQSLTDKGAKFLTEPKDQPWGVRNATFVDPDGKNTSSNHSDVRSAAKPLRVIAIFSKNTWENTNEAKESF